MVGSRKKKKNATPAPVAVTLGELQATLDLAEAQLDKAMMDLRASHEMLRETKKAMVAIRGTRANPIVWELGRGFYQIVGEWGDGSEPEDNIIFHGGPTT